MEKSLILLASGELPSVAGGHSNARTESILWDLEGFSQRRWLGVYTHSAEIWECLF